MSKNIVFDFYGVIFDSRTGEINKDVLNLIFSLKNGGYRLHIFTNTNLDHIHKVDEVNPFVHFFDSIVSCIDFPKPSKEAFESLLNSLNSNVEDIVFVDDSEENILVAKEFGIMGILFTNVEELEFKLKNFSNDN